MATTETIDIDTETNRVHLSEVTVHDDTLVDYLQEFDPHERDEALERALTVGAATLQLAETEKELEYVRREFEDLHTRMSDEVEDVEDELEEKLGDDGILADVLEEYLGDEGTLREHLDDAFGEEGVFTERLDEELGEDGERIQAALDPDTDGTPTNRLLSRLKGEIQELREELIEEEAQEEIRSQTTLKGEDFEDEVKTLLKDYCHQTPHDVVYTGETEGELDGRDVGDFVVDFGDTDQHLVIEAKSEYGYSKPDIRDEMDDAIRNRNADYGLFVSECQEYVPNEIGFLQEFENFVAVCVSQDEDDEIDPRLFRMGLNWAKMRAGHAALDSDEEVDAELIQAKTEEIEAALDQFSTIKRKCTTIRGTADEIDEELSDINDTIIEELHAIQGELTVSGE